LGYLLGILLALVAHGLVEGGFYERVGPVWLVPALLGVPYLVAGLARALGRAGRFGPANRVARLGELVPAALHYAALGMFGWQETVEGWVGRPVSLLEWPRASLLLLLAPFVLFTLAGIDAQARLHSAQPQLRGRIRRFQGRMFASAMTPVTVYVLLAALVGASDALRMRIETIALWNALFSVGLLSLFALFLPFVLRNTWETVPLPAGPERTVLEHVARHARFSCRDLLVWRTGGLVANAAIVGLTPRDRVVVFTDSLLAQLDLRQLAAVFAHEIGHAKGRHVLVFLAWAGAAFLGADLVVTWIAPEETWMVFAALGLAVILWALGFGWMSRRFELQADLYSLGLLGDPVALSTALEEVGGHAREATGWRHFSIGDRLRYIARVSADPGLGRRLDRRLKGLARLGFVLLGITLALQVRGLAQDFPTDQVALDLRLGRYASAGERLTRIGDPPAELARLVAVAAELGDGADLGQRALAALGAGRGDLAADYLLLGDLAGDRELARAREVLFLVRLGLEPEAREKAVELSGPWRQALLGE
jgi:Zn-dependent protease with chaperone function